MSGNVAYYAKFVTQWATLTPGTVAARLAQINAQTVAQSPLAKVIISGSQLYNTIVPAEFQALTAPNQQLIRDLWSLGPAIDATVGTNVRNTLLQVFTAGSGPLTRTALSALQTAVTTPPPLLWWQANDYRAPFNTDDVAAAGVS